MDARAVGVRVFDEAGAHVGVDHRDFARFGRFENNVVRDDAGNLSLVTASNINVGGRDVSGVDLAFNYQRPGSVALLIGPEGGLDEGEIEAAEAANFEALRLGPRVLRTETAPLAALAIVQSRWGDMS